MQLPPGWWAAAAGAAAAGAVVFPDARVIAALVAAGGVLAIGVLAPACACHGDETPPVGPDLEASASPAKRETWSDLLGVDTGGVATPAVAPAQKGCGCP